MLDFIIFIILLFVVIGVVYYIKNRFFTQYNELETKIFETPLHNILVNAPDDQTMSAIDDDIVASSVSFNFDDIKLAEPLYSYTESASSEFFNYETENNFNVESNFVSSEENEENYVFDVEGAHIPTFENNNSYAEATEEATVVEMLNNTDKI